MFALKQYQQKILDALSDFLSKARIFDAEIAFCKISQNSNKNYEPIAELPSVPYICLRVPTGGGKTYLAANTVKIVSQNYLDRDFPVVLWLTPTTTIKEQTIDTLKNINHPNRQVLESAFNGNVGIYDILEFDMIRPQDIRKKACIIVSTIQSFRVDKTEGRLIYAHNENLEVHFDFASVPDDIKLRLERIESGQDVGKIKYSFSNLLHINKPLVIVDEAHNATTELSYKVMERVNPACIVEFTATPAINSNVLVKVSAMELKAEEMIKLPIILTESQSWGESVSRSVLKRKKLAEIAAKDEQYIRPIVLIQAESKGRDVTVEVVKDYLLKNEKVYEEQIAVATGEQRELDNIDILDRECKIEYVITKQALKEGWDCPFAYIFCSVANTKSAKDVEQLLGRVLRMPYAVKRSSEELNKAYAFVSSSCWTNSVNFLQDKLVSMGFENWEAENMLQQDLLRLKEVNPVTFTSKNLDISHLSQSEIEALGLSKNQNGTTVKLTQNTPKELLEKIHVLLPEDEKEKFENTMRFLVRNKMPSPAQAFEGIDVPALCLNIDGTWIKVIDRECYLQDGWNLLDYGAELSEYEFSIRNEGKSFEINVKGEKIVIRRIPQTLDMDLEYTDSKWSELDLSMWLDRRLRQVDIEQSVLIEFLKKIVEYLKSERDISLPNLVRTRFILAEVIGNKIKKYRHEAYAKAYKKLFVASNPNIETRKDFSFKLGNEFSYMYQGSKIFNKHLYAYVGKMNSEEEECAEFIDSLEEVKCWVRNSESTGDSFFLPTSTDNFYPDFVVLLNDGRILVVEYKGEHLLSNDDSKEKQEIGQLWQDKSGGKCLFLMTSKEDLRRKIADKIKG
jgi:type III restriction enzyme